VITPPVLPGQIIHMSAEANKNFSFLPVGSADFETLLGLRILVMREHLERPGRTGAATPHP
jgi:hypothetical protein